MANLTWRGSSRTARVLQAVLLGGLLGAHFVTRLHGQQVTPLQGRHFYPESYFVSLSLLAGRGFGYLLPAGTLVERDGGLAAAKALPLPKAGAAAWVVGFVRLAGQETISPEQLAAYLGEGATRVDPDPIETTRVFDIYLAAALWRLFGMSWAVYFTFYALLSTAAGFCLFLIAQRATASFWVGIAAATGFLASPLEHYSGVWSIRDTAPLWFTALAFGSLAWFSGLLHDARATAPRAFAVGLVASLGLGWRTDCRLVPPLLFVGLVVMLVSQRQPWLRKGRALAAFCAGCAVVLLLIRALGPPQPMLGGATFHIAWYGEATRSNLLQTENAFQVIRDDRETLYQANYFARGRYRGSDQAEPAFSVQDLRHHRRSRDMYYALARYQAWNWWSGFPAFLARNTQLDRPTLLASDHDAEAFLARRRTVMTSLHEWALNRYGALLPWLIPLGLVGGFLDERSRLTTALMAGYFVCYAAVLFLVLPEAKHMTPLLLPAHVLGALGLWSAARAVGSWREVPTLIRTARPRLALLASVLVALLLAWGGLGAAAHVLSRQQRSRILESVRSAAATAESSPEAVATGKLFSVHTEPASATAAGYLLKLRASRQASLLCIHVRGTSVQDGFHAYYTRHPIEPGADRLFFFNIVSGIELGDERPYTAYVRLVGPAQLISSRRLDLWRWPLGLPLSLVFDSHDQGTARTMMGTAGAAIERLPVPSEVGHLLQDPGAFLSSYRSVDLSGWPRQ